MFDTTSFRLCRCCLSKHLRIKSLSTDCNYNSLCRFVLRCLYRTHHSLIYGSLNWWTSWSKRQFHRQQFIFKCIFLNYPSYLKWLLIPYPSFYRLRQTEHPLFFGTLAPRVSPKKSGDVLLNLKHRLTGTNYPVQLDLLPYSIYSKHLCSLTFEFPVLLLTTCETSPCNCITVLT